MESSTSHAVSLERAAPRTIAAVRARLAPGRVPLEFARYLDQVYAARASGMRLDGQNIFVYRDAVDQTGHLDIEFSVGIAAPFVPVGDVRPVDLPVGEIATTTHRGAYTGLGAAHDAVLAGAVRMRAHPRGRDGKRTATGPKASCRAPTSTIFFGPPLRRPDHDHDAQ